MRSRTKAETLHGALAVTELRNIEEIIGRFDPARRSSVRRLIASSPRIADLALVFPGALYALASRFGAAKRRQRAIDLILKGAPLKDVAAALELPLWLRRLPPEAFSGRFASVPTCELFSRRIANHLPTASEDSAFWLKSVTFAATAADNYFALWLAQQAVFMDPGEPERLFGLLAAYAWLSNHERCPVQALIVVPWRPEMALDTAVCAAKSWLNRMRLVLQLDKGVITDPWLEPGEARGLTFVPLLDSAAILAESQAMQNCADQYADRLARDKCRLFSVRRRGQRVATLEIGPHPREAGVLAICQLKARHNLPVPAEVWQASHTWLGSQRDIRRPPAGAPPERPLCPATWEKLMAPYRASKTGAPWLPERATKETFGMIEGGIAELARRAGITSWLFT